jgi:hypothetical protein
MPKPTVFDKAKWHNQGKFPEDIDNAQAFVHTGLFLGWVIESGLHSDEFAADYKNEIRRFKARRMTGPGVYRAADGVFDGGREKRRLEPIYSPPQVTVYRRRQ